MKVTADIENIDEKIEKLKEFYELEKKINDEAFYIGFLTANKVAELTGWSKPTVDQLFNTPDFPVCDFGKSKIVEVHALLEYFSVPRRKNRRYWN